MLVCPSTSYATCIRRNQVFIVERRETRSDAITFNISLSSSTCRDISDRSVTVVPISGIRDLYMRSALSVSKTDSAVASNGSLTG